MRIEKRSRRQRSAIWGDVALLVLLSLGGWLAFAQDGTLAPGSPPTGPSPGPSAPPGLTWTFDEGRGFRVAEAGERAPEGRICGARWTPGVSGAGLLFDSIDDFTLIPNSPALNPRRAITLALWVRLDRMPELPWRNDFRFILAKPSLRAYSLVLEQDGTLNASVYVNGARQSVRSRERLPLGEWVHIAFTYDGVRGLGRLYWNGRLASERSGARGLIDANGDALVLGSAFFPGTGDRGGGVRSFPGAIDELRLYPRALAPMEIEQLAQRGRTDSKAALPEPARLVVYAAFEGKAVLARVVAQPLASPEACPEVFYTHQPVGGGEPAPPERPSSGPFARGGASFAGRGERVLQPGEYALSVDVGGGFTSLPVTRTVRLEPGGTTTLHVELSRRYDPRARGYYGADLHLHTYASGDGVTPIEEAVWAQAAADLDVAVISDHNTTVGHRPFIEAAERLRMPYLLSEEITTSTWGHFNVFPLRPGEVIAVAREKTPTEYFQEARAKGARIVQVNHPFWGGGMGYFTRMGDPQFDWGFQAVEVLNGFDGRLDETDLAALKAVFALWTQGKRVTATAGSDDHNADRPTARVGFPRTYVRVDLEEGEELTTERWLTALQAGRAFVTNGPLVYLHPSPGTELHLRPGGALRLRIDVESPRELKALHLWHNGRELETFPLQGRRATVTWEGVVRASGWYAVTVEAEEGGFALTNPVWVKVLSGDERPPEPRGGEL